MTSSEPHNADLALSNFKLDDGPGPALALSPDAQRLLIANTLARAANTQGSVPQKPRARSRRPKVALIWVGVFFAGAAAAAVRTWVAHETAKQNNAAQADSANSVPVQRELLHQAPPETVFEVPPKASGLLAAPLPATSPRGAVPTVAPPAVQPQTPAAQARARDLLSQANSLRKARRYSEALRLYQEVSRSYPGSLQAQAAQLAAADLQLEHLGDPEAARQLYSQVSKKGGALSAEAAYGLAETYRKSGDVARERAALESLLQNFTDSPLRRSAQRRLDALRRSDKKSSSDLQP